MMLNGMTILLTLFVATAIGSLIEGDGGAISTVAYNATVSKTEEGAYRTLTDALAGAPAHSETRYYIHVEAGIYFEHVVVWENQTNITLVGDGATSTKIQFNRHSPDYRTFETATLTVEGRGFVAMFMTIENTAGDGSQAVAALTMADEVAFYKCTFLGYQDTLYAKRGVQFYKNCDIYGTVDYIFGAASAVFQTCNLYARVPKVITVTAQNKGKHEHSGFVIQNCSITVAPGLEPQKRRFQAYMGRPWSNYSTIIVMESYIDDIIKPTGWLEWKNRTTDELTYLEYENRGPGANTRDRVTWKGYKDMSGRPDKVESFTVGQFILKLGDWLRGTSIPYYTGFTE